MKNTGGGFVADGLTDRAEGAAVEVVAVGVEFVLGKIFVVGDGVMRGEMGFDAFPGVSLLF